jgi:hypothetical protein
MIVMAITSTALKGRDEAAVGKRAHRTLSHDVMPQPPQ